MNNIIELYKLIYARVLHQQAKELWNEKHSRIHWNEKIKTQ